MRRRAPSERTMNELHRLHLRLAGLAGGLIAVRLAPAQSRWHPAVNAYRCGNDFLICVDLAGVEKDAVQVRAEAQRVLISGRRAPPEPVACEGKSIQVLAMEIDYGAFEREVGLPEAIDPQRASAEHRGGWLWVQLPIQVPR